MNIIKDGISKIKDRLTKTEIQRKLKEATSNEHCHANVSLLDEIADKTSNYADFQVIVSHCIRRLGSKKEKWRKILKTLLLIEHILKVGSPNFYDSMKSESHMLKNLHSFSFIDTNRADKGETIRQKSKEILILLNDKQRLKAERENYAKWKGRIEGVSSNGKIGSVSSSSYSNSISSHDHNRNYANKSETKEEAKQSNSESSEDSEEEEKKKKKKTMKKAKKKEDNADKVFEEETSIKANTKASAYSNISIKKPGVGKKETHEAFNPFEDNQSQNNQEVVNDINDIFGNKSKTEVRSNTQQSVNTNNMIDFISFTNTQDSKQNTTAPKNNIPFDLNFSMTGQTSSKNSTDMPNMSTIPVMSNNNQKLETNQLLKMMYSDNNQSKGMNSNSNYNNNNNYNNNQPFNPFNNNIQNPQKPQANTVNPFDLQFSNMNINSSATNANPMAWNNNLNANNNNSWGNNMSNSQGNNFSSGYNLGNQNNINYNKNSNVASGYNHNNNNNNNNQAYNLSGNNTSRNVQTKFNDDDFKEVEEETFKFESKGKGLNSLLDNKLVNLGDLKGNNNNKIQAGNTNNYNFNY